MDEGYKNVCAGIIEQAVHDYCDALKRGDNGQIVALEKWFRSDWGQALSRNNGNNIIERVRKEVSRND